MRRLRDETIQPGYRAPQRVRGTMGGGGGDANTIPGRTPFRPSVFPGRTPPSTWPRNTWHRARRASIPGAGWPGALAAAGPLAVDFGEGGETPVGDRGGACPPGPAGPATRGMEGTVHRRTPLAYRARTLDEMTRLDPGPGWLRGVRPRGRPPASGLREGRSRSCSPGLSGSYASTRNSVAARGPKAPAWSRILY